MFMIISTVYIYEEISSIVELHAEELRTNRTPLSDYLDELVIVSRVFVLHRLFHVRISLVVIVEHKAAICLLKLLCKIIYI